MTKSKGIGKGYGAGRPAKNHKRINITIPINADRVRMYKEYLTILEGHAVEDKDVVNWVRTMLYGEMAQLDDLVSKETERAMIY
jgi:hypothetical protein